MRGRLIAVCGMIGTGKSTLISQLSKLDPSVVTVAQPPEKWKEDPRVLDMLRENPSGRFCGPGEIAFAVQLRMRQQAEEILPALLQGRDVICHRYFYCLAAYYMCFAPAFLRLAYEEASGIIEPDLTMILDAEPSYVLARHLARRKEVFPYQLDLQTTVRTREAYLSLAREHGFMTIDSTKEPPEEVLRKARHAIERLPEKETLTARFKLISLPWGLAKNAGPK